MLRKEKKKKPKKKTWIIEGYYIDEKGMAWTLLYRMDDWRKTKKIKGIA